MKWLRISVMSLRGLTDERKQKKMAARKREDETKTFAIGT